MCSNFVVIASIESQESAQVHLAKDNGSRPQESEQDDKWSFCLTAGTLCQRIRRDDEQTTAPEPYTGLQGESGAGRHQGRSNACPTGGAFRCSPQSDYDMESATRR